MAILVRQVALKNFKSIAGCKVDLRALSILVGPNGSGKSNFVDALRLVSDALNTTLEAALRKRGGINEVRRRSGGHPNDFTISLRLDLGGGRNGHYALRVGAKRGGAFSVQREQAMISASDLGDVSFLVEDGKIKSISGEIGTKPPKITNDRLFLTTVSGIPEFRILFDALSNIRFYSINPDAIKELQVHDAGQRLEESGWNLAAVIKRLAEERPDRLVRMLAYLQQIVPGIEAVKHVTFGPRETLEFRQIVPGQQHPWGFFAANMSDGTLRSLGVLTALFHPTAQPGQAAPFVAVEEPEITIHPGAAAVVMDAMLEAARQEQVLATTHSPDLLDHPEISSESILAVRSVAGETRISTVDEAAMSTIRDALYTPGELLRAGQLSPDVRCETMQIRERDLFGDA